MKTATYLRDLGNGRHLYRLSEPVPMADGFSCAFVASYTSLLDGQLETVLVGADADGMSDFNAHVGLEFEAFGQPPAVSRILAQHGYDLVYPAKAG